MDDAISRVARIRDRIESGFYWLAASGLWPRAPLPFRSALTAESQDRSSPYDLEIVSHCWRYGRLLTYQLSSLLLYPPERARIRMTVFFSPEDEDTRDVLDFFSREPVPNVDWNWCPLENPRLFRRSIGRNLAALATPADWIWFTDCDVTFQENSLDELVSELRPFPGVLAFPRQHQTSDLLDTADPLLRPCDSAACVLELDRSRFRPEFRSKAVGAFQIVPGDVARSVGYCANMGVFQRPAGQFGNTREDRVFRWRLGTQGTPLNTSGFYRLRHAGKGRYGSTFPHRAGVPSTAGVP
jgi:hypothetical protein